MQRPNFFLFLKPQSESDSAPAEHIVPNLEYNRNNGNNFLLFVSGKSSGFRTVSQTKQFHLCCVQIVIVCLLSFVLPCSWFLPKGFFLSRIHAEWMLAKPDWGLKTTWFKTDTRLNHNVPPFFEQKESAPESKSVLCLSKIWTLTPLTVTQVHLDAKKKTIFQAATFVDDKVSGNQEVLACVLSRKVKGWLCYADTFCSVEHWNCFTKLENNALDAARFCGRRGPGAERVFVNSGAAFNYTSRSLTPFVFKQPKTTPPR